MTTTLHPGDEVERLQIEQVLVITSDSVTYRATDLDLNTHVLLRECLPDSGVQRDEAGDVCALPGEEEAYAAARDRFRRHIRRSARLSHPHILAAVRVFAARGTDWCVLPVENGELLSSRLSLAEPVDAETLSGWMSGLMSGLATLHEEGRHPLVSPDNIIIDARGIAYWLDDASQGAPMDAYQAPEHAKSQGTATEASDIYRLAAIGAHALLGAAAPSGPERAQALQTGSTDPIPVLDRSESRGAIIDALELGLELEPENRPRNARRWREGMESIEWRRSVAGARPSGTDTEAREWLAPMLVGAVLAAVAATAIYLTNTEPGDPLPEPVATATQAEPIDPAETARWQASLSADTVLGYRRFIEDFPSSVYLDQAQIQLDILDERLWAQMAEEDTREAYNDYLNEFPGGQHEAEALRKIAAIDEAAAREARERAERERRDQQAWQAALEARSVASMERYLAEWPTGQFVAQARGLRDEIRREQLEERAWESAQKLGTSDAFQAYLDTYPEGSYRAEALISLEHLDLSPGKAFRDCAVCPVMRVVPAGSFTQGSPGESPLARRNEQPNRTVTLPQAFAVGVMEVTFEQWDACVAADGCKAQPNDNGWGRGARPVIMVSWDDAQAYVAWISEYTDQAYRLPSESEWEYAARAGETGDWLGGTPEQLCTQANIAGQETSFRWRHEACSDEQALGTLPGGTLEPNGFGLFDMIGNVSEWTADCMNLSYLDAPTDGSPWGRGICSSHMTRGGAWITGTAEARLPARFNLDNGDRNDFTGFRVLRSINP